MKNIKNVNFTLFLVLMLFYGMPVQALNLDETVDDDIRKNYNSSKLLDDVNLGKTTSQNNNTTTNEQLPKLPNITNNTTTQQSTYQNSIQYSSAQNFGRYKINKRTTVPVINNKAISDSQKSGTKLTFKTQRPVYTKNYTIPAGTTLYGEIIDSHTPQISCNGGLVVISVYAMQIKGETIPINAYITKANGKHIFLNNIKGKRTYLKTVYKKGAWGRAFFGKMMKLTVSLGKDKSTLILTPFPFLYGTICFGGNAILSPVTAFFSKGGKVYIPIGSTFYIKTQDDIYFN